MIICYLCDPSSALHVWNELTDVQCQCGRQLRRVAPSYTGSVVRSATLTFVWKGLDARMFVRVPDESEESPDPEYGL